MLSVQVNMLPVQSLDGSTSHPPRGPTVSLSATDTGENRQQKPKTLPCKYCSKRFRRVEHVQRHERTHTKEKPFQCQWDCCGKTFGRRDLLVRHEKLVHLNEGSKDNTGGPRKNSSGITHKSSLSSGSVDISPMAIQRAIIQPLPAPQTTPPQHNHKHHQIEHHHQQQQHRTPQYHHENQQEHLTPSHHQQPHQIPEPHQQQQQQKQQHSQHHHHPQQQHHQYAQNYAPPVNEHTTLQDSRPAPRKTACNLDLLSDAALASEINHMQPILGDSSSQNPGPPGERNIGDSSGKYQGSTRDDHHGMSSGYALMSHQGSYDDYNPFLDDYSSTPNFLPPHFEPEQQMGNWNRPPGHLGQRNFKPNSQFPTRLNSLAPDHREVYERGEESARAHNLRISVGDHNVIKTRLDEYSSVLPTDFVFPSRHTLTRFLEGYISGFHENLPFLHLPTLSPVYMAPELLLAILAVGAQCRFETNRGHALWYAAKLVAMEQIRRRHSSEMHALLPTSTAYSPHSTRPSPNMAYRHSFASAHSDRPTTQDTHQETFSPNTLQARLETIQAVLLLFAVGLWGAKPILHEALSLQSNLAVLIREEGLLVENSHGGVTDWETWVRLESSTRTKLVAFCFFNLGSIAYDMPPLLLTSEIRLFLPLRSRLWRAETAWQWQELRQSTTVVETTVHEAFSGLFSQSGQPILTQMSSFGNYVLIHALLQHIYLLKQTSLTTGPSHSSQRTLKPEDVEEVALALRTWQTNFEHRHQVRAAESGHSAGPDSTTNGGPLAYNASALLRLAYMRLYTDLPPSRALETRDPVLIASTLNNFPLLMRSLRLHRAVFQAVHALSMLVKAGVNYVARTKSSEWSIQHSFCNFECAILLAKWLLSLASIGQGDPPVSLEERNLLDTVSRMLDETEFAVAVDQSLTGSGAGSGQMEEAMSDSGRLRQLAAAVVRLWAETFKGAHIFHIVKVMGSTLDCYADVIERPSHKTTTLARMMDMGMN